MQKETVLKKNKVISIDTGSNGGLSVFINGVIFCSPFINADNMKDFLLSIVDGEFSEFTAIIESLNIFSNVNGSKNTVYKQGVSFGECIGLLKGLGVNDIVEVSARKWQTYLNLPKKIDYKERKKLLEEKAEELYPIEMNIKKTKKYKSSICDSLLILNYYLQG